MEVKFPKYVIDFAKNGEFMWNLFATNGQIILTSSEQYISRQNCLLSIDKSKKNVADSDFQRKTSSNGQFYFLQRADNYEDLGRSEYYNSLITREQGIESVKRNSPIANIEDKTK